jgi:hypothetical protein
LNDCDCTDQTRRLLAHNQMLLYRLKEALTPLPLFRRLHRLVRQRPAARSLSTYTTSASLALRRNPAKPVSVGRIQSSRQLVSLLPKNVLGERDLGLLHQNIVCVESRKNEYREPSGCQGSKKRRQYARQRERQRTFDLQSNPVPVTQYVRWDLCLVTYKRDLLRSTHYRRQKTRGCPRGDDASRIQSHHGKHSRNLADRKLMSRLGFHARSGCCLTAAAYLRRKMLTNVMSEFRNMVFELITLELRRRPARHSPPTLPSGKAAC